MPPMIEKAKRLMRPLYRKALLFVIWLCFAQPQLGSQASARVIGSEPDDKTSEGCESRRSDLQDAVDDQKSVDKAAQGQQEDYDGDGCEDFIAHTSFPLIK